MKRGITISVLLLFLLPMILLITPANASTSSTITMYQHYSSTLEVNPSGIRYSYSSAFYTTTSAQQEQITYSSYSYDVSVGSLTTFSGQIKVTVSQYNITVYSSIPQLARVLLIEPGLIKEVVWAGFTNTSATISGLAYFNSSAQLVLQYLNGSSFANITLSINHAKTSFSNTTSLLLHKVNLTPVGETQFTLSIYSTQPERYHAFEFQYQGVPALANYNTSIAYFNGTYVPAMIWHTQISGLFSVDSFKLGGNVEFTEIEFFGINGSVAGYIENHFFSNYVNTKGMFVQNTHYSVSSDLKIVIYPSVKVSQEKVSVIITISGMPVVIIITNNGGVESTGNVILYHQVYVNSSATLVLVNVVNGQGYVIVYQNGAAQPVNLVTPTSVTFTNVTLNGKSYTAQEVTVSGSGNIVFNVTMMKNETFAVFKQTSSGLVQLNPSNYFVYNGSIVVFDDPSTTYYIVYGYSPSPSTSYPTLAIIIAIIVIIVAVALAVLRKR